MKKHKQALQAASSVTIHWLEALKNWKFRLLQGNYWKYSQWVLFFINYTHTILPIHNWTKWTFNSLFYTLFLIIMKKEKTRHFGRFELVNSYAPHTEQTKIFHNWRLLATGYYHWINRTWQRYDYEMSLYDALYNLTRNMSWRDFEFYKKDIAAVKKVLQDMHDYNWSNWS